MSIPNIKNRRSKMISCLINVCGTLEKYGIRCEEKHGRHLNDSNITMFSMAEKKENTNYFYHDYF